MTVSELQVKVSADTSAAEQGLSALGSKVGSAGSAIATAFGGAAIAGIAALGAGLAASVATASTFEAKMSAISAVSGATASEMDSLREKALQLGADTSFSASEAAEGINELIKAGVSVGDVLGGGAAAALSLAAAGGLSVAESAEIASNAMNVFSLSGADVGHVADVIAGAANASAIDVHDFGMSLAASGAVAATVGIGFDDLGTAIAVMGQAGIKGSDAGTSLKTMLLNLTPSSKSASSEMKALGIITADGANKFFDAEGKAKSLADISGVLQTATAGLTEQQKLQALQTMFGTDAIRAAAIMAKAGSEGFTEMASSIGKVTAEAVAAERLNNLKGDVEQLTGSLETAGIKIGTAFLPGLRSITQGATEIVNKAAPVLEQFAKDAAADIQTASTQIQDAWRTAKQAFAGEWLPSKDIPPFVNNVGLAATALGRLRDGINDAIEIAKGRGAFDDLGRAWDTLKTAAGDSAKNIDRTSEALRQLGIVGGQSLDWPKALGLSIKVLALDLNLAALGIAGVADGLLTMAAVGGNSVAALAALGKAVAALATGDLPGAAAALDEWKTAFGRAKDAASDWATNSAARVKEGASTISQIMQTETELAAVVAGRGMSKAAAEVGTGAAEMSRFMEENVANMDAIASAGMASVATSVETGMGQAVASVESQAPVAVAAAEAMGTGMAAGIETAAPAMAAAAESGASSAVAAVQAQEGAASGAGQSLGAALGSGLEGGILAYAGRVASAAARLLQGAIAAASGPEGADAHSPSKKTEKLGKDLAEGLEVGLNSSNLGAEMQAKIRDFIAASRDYIPVAGEIARVEDEIKRVRDDGATAALFRAKDMITIDSEALRLKGDMVQKEKDLLPVRQDIARASREIEDAERGLLSARQFNLAVAGNVAQNNIYLNQLEKEKIPLQQRSLQIERELLGITKDTEPAKRLQIEQEEIRKKLGLIDNTISQQRLLTRAQELDAASIKEAGTVAATAGKIRSEALQDQARLQERAILTIKEQLDVLGLEREVFNANEAVIKNATDNEIDYRNRLIAVFKSEATPLTDRIAAGVKLIDQLEKEGRISKDLAGELRGVATEAGKGALGAGSIGSASAVATPQMAGAAEKANQIAAATANVAAMAARAADEMRRLAENANRLPSLFNPGFNFNFGGGRANGGPVTAGTSYLVGERGVPEIFTPRRSGQIIPADVTRSWMGGSGESRGAPQMIRLDLALGGRVAKSVVIEGYDLAVKSGWTPGGLTG